MQNQLNQKGGPLARLPGKRAVRTDKEWASVVCHTAASAKCPLMNLIRIAAVILLTFGLSAASAYAGDLSSVGDPESLGFSPARLSRITSWYQARVEARELPGAVVAIARNGELAYMQATGFQDAARKIPMTKDSIFWIASMTKPVTSVAAMMLVEEGRLG